MITIVLFSIRTAVSLSHSDTAALSDKYYWHGDLGRDKWCLCVCLKVYYPEKNKTEIGGLRVSHEAQLIPGEKKSLRQIDTAADS